MDFTHLNTLEMENQGLFDWVHSGEALGDATYISNPICPPVLYGGALDPTTEILYDHPPPIDPLYISPISAIPRDYYHLPPCKAPTLDDFNFDSFPWEDSLLVSNGEIEAALAASTDQHSNSNGYHVGGIPCEERRQCSTTGMAPGRDAITGLVESVKRQVEKGPSVRAKSSSIGFDEVSEYFCMPITEAAKAMKVGLTVLKRRCRELGISRWPHRKMKSLNSLIRNVQELGKGVLTEDSIKREVESLEEHKRLMGKMPEMQLTERTKKLRQACFKANFKKRRAL